jgi:hypothetical protein
MTDATDDLPDNTDLVIDFATRHPDAYAQIGDIVAEKERRRHLMLNSAEHHAKLKKQVLTLLEAHEFKPGEFVTWKEGLKNRKRPEYGEPVVVVEVLDQFLTSDKFDSASSYFNEPLDIVLGMLNADDELITYHFDRRRFQPLG